jgi:hypothetical protein
MSNKLLKQDSFGNWNFEKCSKEDLNFTLEDDTEVLIVDWQLGHEDVHLQTLKNLVDWCLEKPHRYCVLQDFLDDNWLSKFNILSYGSDSETEELKRLEQQLRILKPIYHRFLFQIGSNHWMRRFGLNLPAQQSQRARTQFNKIYGKIYQENINFKQYYSTECLITLKFKTKPSLKIPFLHPSRLGSSTTAMNRVLNYGDKAYGVAIGHVHSNIQKTIQTAYGHTMRIWFASHLFAEQPEYEKERMATFEPSKPLILSWKKDPLTKRDEFTCQ